MQRKFSLYVFSKDLIMKYDIKPETLQSLYLVFNQWASLPQLYL